MNIIKNINHHLHCFQQQMEKKMSEKYPPVVEETPRRINLPEKNFRF